MTKETAEFNKFFKLDDVVLASEKSKFNLFRISWKMFDFCPYACPYCYMADLVKRAKLEKELPTIETLIERAKNINNYIKFRGKDKIKLHLIGGEVTYYNLIPILDEIKTINNIQIVSNFYRDFDYWKNLIDYLNTRNIKISFSASLHLSAINTPEKEKDFCEKAIQINDYLQKNIQNPYIFVVKMVSTNDTIDKFFKISDYLTSHGVRSLISVARNSDQIIVSPLSDEIYKKIDDKNSRLDIGKKVGYQIRFKDGTSSVYKSSIQAITHCDKGTLDFTGFTCDAGLHGIRVLEDGRLLGGHCTLLFNYGTIGYIDKPETWLKEEDIKPFICTTHFKNKDGQPAGHPCTGCHYTINERPEKPVKLPNYYQIWLDHGKPDIGTVYMS